MVVTDTSMNKSESDYLISIDSESDNSFIVNIESDIITNVFLYIYSMWTWLT